MELEKIESMLGESLQDYVMSRSERREFKELMSDCKGDTRKAAMVRGLAFRLAQQKVEESHQVLEWLENVVKVIYAKESEVKNKVCFSPGDECLNEIKAFVSGAVKTLDICVFTITDNRIVERIEAAWKRGVKVRVIADDDKSLDLGADVLAMQKFGIPTVFDVTDAHMHHKFAIADSKRVLTGSYNWTRAAARENDENIIISNDGAIVRQFSEEYERMWNKLSPLQK